MISEKPLLGHGPGSFTFSSLPYQTDGGTVVLEGSLFKNPHNDFLLTASEYGLPVLFLTLFLLAKIVISSLSIKYQGIRSLLTNQSSSTLLLFTIGLIIESNLQSPLSNPYVVCVLALVIAQALKSAYKTLQITMTLDRLLRLSFLPILIYVTSGWAIAKHQLTLPQAPYMSLKSSCLRYPEIYVNCLNLAARYMQLNQPSRALATIDSALEYEPHNAVAIRYRAVILSRLGHIADSCQTFHEYRRYFPIGKSHLRAKASVIPAEPRSKMNV